MTTSYLRDGLSYLSFLHGEDVHVGNIDPDILDLYSVHGMGMNLTYLTYVCTLLYILDSYVGYFYFKTNQRINQSINQSLVGIRLFGKSGGEDVRRLPYCRANERVGKCRLITLRVIFEPLGRR